MSDYLPESRSVEARSTVYAPTSYTTALHSKAGRGLLDTTDRAESQSAQTKRTSLKSSFSGTRVSLVPPQSNSPQNELLILAEAFVAAYTAMNKSIQAQTSDYVELQELDQTQTQSVLQSTRNAINKQKAAVKLAAEVSEYEKKLAKENEIFGWVMMGVGIALAIVCFAAGFVSFGATAVVAPEIIEATELAATAAPEVAEEAAPEAIELSDTADSDMDVEGEGEGVTNSAEEMSDMMSQTTENVEENTQQVSESVSKDLSSSDAANTKSALKFAARSAKFFGKIGYQVAVAGVFGSPMLMKGIVSLKVQSKLEDVAAAQKLVGGALDTLQRNTMFFQFLQRLIQREGGVLQEEVSDASEVVDTFASITSAYRGISYGLANAV